MNHSVKRRLATALAALGLSDAAFRTLGFLRRLRQPGRFYENRRLRRMGAPDGLPIPPDGLLYLISGEASVSSYLGGSRSAAGIRSLLAENGYPMESMSAILDFGCGCGRILRHWSYAEPRAFGCDYSDELVQWCEANLPDVAVKRNDLLPPLPYGSQVFDLVYAVSVFTHMPLEAQRAWINEIHRVLRPGGALLVTFHGAAFTHLLTAHEARQFVNGSAIVSNAEYFGTNVCASFNPESHVCNVLAPEWDVQLFRPSGGVAVGVGEQDLYILNRRP